jgi:hypothetical protein
MPLRFNARLGCVWMVLHATAHACTVCDSQTGHQVRGGIFDGRFARTFGIVMLPGVLLTACMIALHAALPYVLKEDA